MEALYRITYYARSKADYSKILGFGSFASNVTGADVEYVGDTCLLEWEQECKKQLDSCVIGDYYLDMQVARLV